MADAAATTPVAPPAVDRDIAKLLGIGPGRRVRRFAIRIAIAAAVIAVVGGGVWWWRSRSAKPPVSYVTAPVTRGELEVTVTATGTLEPRHVVDVGAEVSGRLRRVLVDYNAKVTRGQLIAEIDPELLEAQLHSARAQLRQTRAQLQQARATQREARGNRARAEGLHAKGVIATQELDAAVAAAERADAAVQLAAAGVEQATAAQRVASTNLTRTAIHSPIDGVVLERKVEVGQTVVAAFQAPVLFTIAEDLAVMKVSVDIDEADIGLIAPGQRATFAVSAYLGREFTATVASVHDAARLVDRVVSYEAELDVDNHDLVLKPGMTVTAQIVARRVDDALTVPSQALRFTPVTAAFNKNDTAPTGAQVWVLRDGKPVAVPVEAGLATETRTEIRAGTLAAGDAVIVDAR